MLEGRNFCHFCDNCCATLAELVSLCILQWLHLLLNPKNPRKWFNLRRCHLWFTFMLNSPPAWRKSSSSSLKLSDSKAELVNSVFNCNYRLLAFSFCQSCQSYRTLVHSSGSAFSRQLAENMWWPNGSNLPTWMDGWNILLFSLPCKWVSASC